MEDLNNDPNVIPKILIITRVLPVKNTGGSESYLLEMIRHLISINFKIKIVLLEPLQPISAFFLIPREINKYCTSVYRTIRLFGIMFRFKFLLDAFIVFVGLTYYLLPRSKRNFFQNQFLKFFKKLKFNFNNKKSDRENKNYFEWKDRVTLKLSLEEIDFIGNQIKIFNPHIVLANYAFIADAFDKILSTESVLRIILTHDLFAQRYASFKYLNLEPDINKSHVNDEINYLKKADILIAIQDNDKKLLNEMIPSCTVVTIPMPATLKIIDPSLQVKNRCLFVGSNAIHNIISINWFLTNIWPIILNKIPTASLHVCGNVCRGISKNYANVSLKGKIENLDQEYSEASVCIIPLIVGSGLKIKLIEALSYGRACISTDIGIQGLEMLENKAILVGNTCRKFSNQLVSILLDDNRRIEMERFAKKYVEENLSPKNVYQPLLNEIYNRLKILSHQPPA